MQKTHNKYKNQLNYTNHLIKFGSLGLKSKSYFLLSKSKYILLYDLVLKKIKQIVPNQKVKIWKLIVFNKSLTKLPLESRMGKGKGSIYETANFIKPGIILFEFLGLSKENLIEINLVLKNKIGQKFLLVNKYNN
uniref:ribosomal protein L16 n=1 Tax=Heterosiphonia pulchra TaxID=189631 RepID=UPI002E7A635A|nr:ribosomal protein L16 [Heterosiphonia pulchra]WQF69552.1 ribosomal protein L16 [Heterosiphonia pulchra]